MDSTFGHTGPALLRLWLVVFFGCVLHLSLVGFVLYAWLKLLTQSLFFFVCFLWLIRFSFAGKRTDLFGLYPDLLLLSESLIQCLWARKLGRRCTEQARRQCSCDSQLCDVSASCSSGGKISVLHCSQCVYLLLNYILSISPQTNLRHKQPWIHHRKWIYCFLLIISYFSQV